MIVPRMIGEHFQRHAAGLALEAPHQPDHAPRVVSRLRADVCAGVIGIGLDLSREFVGFGVGPKADHRLRKATIADQCAQDAADQSDRLIPRIEVDDVVMDIVRDFMAQHAGQFFFVFANVIIEVVT